MTGTETVRRARVSVTLHVVRGWLATLHRHCRVFLDPTPVTRYEEKLLRTALNATDAVGRREAEVLRIADVLRAVERATKGPFRTPQEMARAMRRVREILRSTGLPEEGYCDRCGKVALQRRGACPRCDLTAADGVRRGRASP